VCIRGLACDLLDEGSEVVRELMKPVHGALGEAHQILELLQTLLLAPCAALREGGGAHLQGSQAL
jgi:hypothetical protein